MKKTVVLLLLAATLAQAEPLADRVSHVKLWGKGHFGECTPFAVALSQWLTVNQQQSRVIFYTYRSAPMSEPVTHAIVAWERAGTWWAMGNELPRPRRIGILDPASLGIAQRYDPRAYAAMRVR